VEEKIHMGEKKGERGEGACSATGNGSESSRKIEGTSSHKERGYSIVMGEKKGV